MRAKQLRGKAGEKVRCCFYLPAKTQAALERMRSKRIRQGVKRSEANTSVLVEEAVRLLQGKGAA